jgi:hypothetical protein
VDRIEISARRACEPPEGKKMTSKIMRFTGYALTGAFSLFMLFDVAIKLMRHPMVEQTMQMLGFPPGLGFPIGMIETLCLVLYLVKRTSLLGAVLFTGVFGGAIATHLRHADPLFSHVLFGVYLGAFMWGGLWLRDPALRTLFPFRRMDA